MTAFDRNVFVKMLLSVPQKDDAALFPKSERSPYIQKLLETFDKEETIDLSIIDWDAFQIENVTPENYERVYHRVFDGWIQGFIHYCRKAPVFQRQERLSFEVPVMYGIEYEDDILLLLRMIKFLHMQSPDAAHIFCQSYPVVDMEELLMVIDEVMWDIFDDVNFFFDEEYEATVVQCSHPIIDRLYEQGRASDPKHGSRQSVWSKKLHDITEYFVLGATNSVYKFSQHIAGDHVVLEFCLSPDYYEPLYFANSLVDLLRYCQCSIRRIEAKLAERETENIRKEAA